MLYEFRRDFTIGGKLAAYKSLFEGAGTQLFAKHEIEAVAYFDVVIGPGMADQFPYLLRWNSFEERTEKTAALESDPEWLAAVVKAESDGPLLVDSSNQLWSPTYYSRVPVFGDPGMLYEYRTSQCIPNKKGVVHWRNAEYNRRLYERHGMDYVAAFDAVVGNSSYVHYMLRWNSLEERNEKWANYFRDPDFQEVATRTGPLTLHVPNEIWTPTTFSPTLK